MYLLFSGCVVVSVVVIFCSVLCYKTLTKLILYVTCDFTMSNRKESLKKSLGLSEYPWSSDDEDTQPPSQNDTVTPAENSEPPRSTTTPGTSGGIMPSILPARRNRARLEQELFWTLLDREIMPGQSSRPSTSGTSSYEPPRPTEIIDLNSPVSNLQRLFAIKKLTRNQNRTPRGNFTNMPIESQRARMQPLSVAGRLRRRLRGISMRNSVPSPIIVARDPTQDEEAASPEIISLDTNQEENENVNNQANPSAVGTSEGDDVVEIDADMDDIQDVAAGEETREQEQPSDDEPVVESAPASTTDNQESRVAKRKRDDDDAGPTTVEEFNQRILRLLECPVCLEWIEPPMCQCRRGHLVCGKCRARLDVCPVCRTNFSSVRNRGMEAVIELIRYPCRYGCGRELSFLRRGAHEASCESRRYRCPAPACVVRPPLSLPDLSHHFQTKHLALLKIGRKHKFSMKVNKEKHDHWLVMAVRELFHLRIDVDVRTWGVNVYVTYIGPKSNAAKFTYEVSVLGLHNERKLVYRRTTHSDVESSLLNVSRQDCFYLTIDQALNFLRFKNRHCEPDKYLNFEVEITKHEPAEDNRNETDS